jgi:hypothetical protein
MEAKSKTATTTRNVVDPENKIQSGIILMETGRGQRIVGNYTWLRL